MKQMESLTLHSPAKINLMLAVHGRREDGFHALTSLVATLGFGDTLEVAVNHAATDRLSCSDPVVPPGDGNLVLRAAEAFRRASSSKVYFDFDLEKRIPVGAGLGGGSSNAAVALNAMNQLSGKPLKHDALIQLSAELGSDCPLFIDSVPTIMTGRGEILSPLESKLIELLRGQKLVLFKPPFSINTAWAYRQLIESQPSAYTSEQEARTRLAEFAQGESASALLFNTFEPCVGRKYLAIPCLLEQLRKRGHSCLMSGSGSCCFALVADSNEAESIQQLCRQAWGDEIFFVETLID
jgi:4-diphosphocytidyl-2-C-methyl-D-erythritol kinase